MAIQANLPGAAGRDLSGDALRAFFRIADAWKLDSDQERRLLGSPSHTTFFRWKHDQSGVLGRDVFERISYLLSIYKSLHILFANNAQADAWIRRPNQAALFGGASALDRILGGQVGDLFVVRQYLDAERSGI